MTFPPIDVLRRLLKLFETRVFRRFDPASRKYDEQAQADEIASLKRQIDSASRRDDEQD